MPRGIKTSPEIISQIIKLKNEKKSISEISGELGVSYATVRKILDADRENSEKAEEEDEFLTQSAEIMGIALERLRIELENTDKSIPLNQLTSAIYTIYDRCNKVKPEENEDNRIEVDINVI